jgi:hypothetical protein
MYPPQILRYESPETTRRAKHQYDQWVKLSQLERQSVRAVAKESENIRAFSAQLSLAIILVVILSPMAGTVLKAQSIVDGYQAATCRGINATVSWNKCVSFLSVIKFCGKVSVESIDRNGTIRMSVIRYPNHSPLLVPFYGVDVVQWLNVVQSNKSFTCYLDSELSRGVVDPELEARWGWIIMAIIAAFAAMMIPVLIFVIYNACNNRIRLFDHLDNRPDLKQYLLPSHFQFTYYILDEKHVLQYKNADKLGSLDQTERSLLREANMLRESQEENWCMSIFGVVLFIFITLSLTVIIDVRNLSTYHQTQCLRGPSNISKYGACAYATFQTIDGNYVRLRHPAAACRIALGISKNEWLQSLSVSSGSNTFTCYVSGNTGVSTRTIKGYKGWIVMLVTGVVILLIAIGGIVATVRERIRMMDIYSILSAKGMLHFL